MDSKRLLDLALTLPALPVVAPLVGALAVAVKLDSKGPAFFAQTRVGQGRRPLKLYKLRSMVDGADRKGPAVTSGGDPRVTRLGRILRKTKLDELPQLFNVVRGEMSLVGPRPERPEFTEQLEQEIPFFRARLLAKPGLTGWAQVNYGYAGTVADNALKLQWDLYYIKHQSLWMDVLIMIRTLPVIFGFRGT